MRLENRVAVITGAGRGIGQEIAFAYAREGARLVLAARTLSQLEETAHRAESLGAETCVVATDVGDQAQVDEMVRRALERYSTVDILVNNAGITGPVGPLYDNDVSHWTQTIRVNLIGTYLCCRAVLPTMLANNRGKIVNMHGGRGRHLSAYGASKIGVVDITETLAEELEGRNIQINAITPGSIHTSMWDETYEAAVAIGDAELTQWGERVLAGRGASMERAVELAVFLASDDSGSMSGRLISSMDDDFSAFPSHIAQIMDSDVYKVRRVEPA
jgi:3-oxoacyl-[acyl-carrier protein] reductase